MVLGHGRGLVISEVFSNPVDSVIQWFCDQLPSPSPHLILPGLQGQAPEALRLREGDTLYVQCPYAPWTTDSQTKYWCLLKDGRCQELVSTYSKQSRDRRIIINDDSTTETVSVTMAALKAEDSGTYFCAGYYSYTYPRLRTISLIVFRGEYLYPTQSQALPGSIIPSPALPPSPPQLSSFPWSPQPPPQPRSLLCLPHRERRNPTELPGPAGSQLLPHLLRELAQGMVCPWCPCAQH